MRPNATLTFTACLFALWLTPADAEGPPAPVPATASDLRIEWQVQNRFRLFRTATDFDRHVAAHNTTVLAAEQELAQDSDGRGWARDIVERLCTDRGGSLLETCERDGVREDYLAPKEHAIIATISGAPTDASCLWSFEDGASVPRQVTVPCTEEVNLRVAYGRTTRAAVEIDGRALRTAEDIAVQDLLIAGLGDSVAAGEGNPDRPVQLSDGGFCFRRFGNGAEYYRPGRAGFTGNKACATTPGETSPIADWARQSARWMSGPCHRSLYGYQMRAALALAVENPHHAVTFIPLACTGATINRGLLGEQRIRECPTPGHSSSCASTVPGQLSTLKAALTAAQKSDAARKLDLVLLTVGANDILFSGLVADVIVETATERVIFEQGGVIASVDRSERILETELPRSFERLRVALKPLVGGDLSRVVYVTYGHPALASAQSPCPGGRDGFDIHPAFTADATRLRRASDFVSARFLPRIKELATCDGVGLCREPDSDRMTFVNAHQAAFASHGFCARSVEDPPFDQQCFSAEGKSFRDDADAATEPMACGVSASEFRPYAPRARWIRTANDSYFTAMTYPDGVSSALQPADIHDATWAVLASVYGGAIHPTAEGHAAMADAALGMLRTVLALNPVPVVTAEPLVPVTGGSSPPSPGYAE